MKKKNIFVSDKRFRNLLKIKVNKIEFSLDIEKLNKYEKWVEERRKKIFGKLIYNILHKKIV